MPEESINIFISNIYAIAIFTGLFAAIFLCLFFISRVLIFRTRRSAQSRREEKTSLEAGDQKHAGTMLIIRKDIYFKKNLLVAGLLFIFTALFIILILLSFLFATQFRMDGSFYMIFAIIFIILVMTVYIVRSKLLER